MRVNSVRKSPRAVTTPSTCAFRMAAWYASESVNVTTALPSILKSPVYILSRGG
jgi:hypothetical protein